MIIQKWSAMSKWFAVIYCEFDDLGIYLSSHMSHHFVWLSIVVYCPPYSQKFPRVSIFVIYFSNLMPIVTICFLLSEKVDLAVGDSYNYFLNSMKWKASSFSSTYISFIIIRAISTWIKEPWISSLSDACYLQYVCRAFGPLKCYLSGDISTIGTCEHCL